MSNVPGAPFDPYQPPKPVEPKPSATLEDGKVRYMYTYSYVFENPNWMSNILYGTLCMIIPVVGPLVLMGYQFEIVESLLRQPGRVYPDFDLNKFSQYLMRGVWPFLVSLVCSLPITFLIMIFYIFMFIGIGGAAALGGKDYGPILMVIVFFVEFFVMMLLSVVLGMLIQPFVLRAGLSQDFGQAFKFGWVMDFLKKNWKEMLLFQLFFVVTSLPLVMLGMLLCFIGIYPAIALLILAQAHMQLQLYRLHLSRGGEPVPLKDPPPEFGMAS